MFSVDTHPKPQPVFPCRRPVPPFDAVGDAWTRFGAEGPDGDAGSDSPTGADTPIAKDGPRGWRRAAQSRGRKP